MSNSNFLCVAVFTVKENQEKRLLKELNFLVEKTVQESGCISYELFTSHTNPSKVLVQEVYKSEEDFKVHTGSDYLQSFIKKAPDLIEHSDVKTA